MSFKITLLFCILSIASLAQNENFNNDSLEPNFERLQTKLNLSDEQLNDIQKLHNNLRLDAQKLKDDLNLTEEDRKQEMSELRSINESRIKSILSEEQYQEFQKMRSHRQNKRRHRRERRE